MPAQVLKSAEITIARAEGQTVLDGQGGKMGVMDKTCTDTMQDQKAAENFQMPFGRL